MAGRITESNFSAVREVPGSEHAELDEKIEQLQSAIATEARTSAEKWIALMKVRQSNRTDRRTFEYAD